MASRALAAWAAAVLPILLGCSRGPARLYPPRIDAVAAGIKAIQIYDSNKDGKLDGAELDACPALRAALARIDRSGDGTITAAAITARIKTWQDSGIGRLSLDCTVLRRGKVLPEAEVKLVPETFLGSKMPIASGKTDREGVARISVPTSGLDDPPGLPPGFYRVEITKPGERIPAKYSTATTLGLEAAPDLLMTAEKTTFDLEYD